LEENYGGGVELLKIVVHMVLITNIPIFCGKRNAENSPIIPMRAAVLHTCGGEKSFLNFKFQSGCTPQYRLVVVVEFL
jgi:hypothetical protein